MSEATPEPAAVNREPLTIHQAVAEMDRQDRIATTATTDSEPATKATAETAAVNLNEELSGSDEVEQTEAEPEEAAEESTEEQDETAEGDDEETLVQLKDGSQVPLKELVAGYMKDDDYRRKTAAAAEATKAAIAREKATEAKERQIEEALTARLKEAEAVVAAAAARRDEWNRRVQEYDKAVASQRDSWGSFDWDGLQAKIDNALAQGDQFAAAQASAEYTSAYARFQAFQRAEQQAQAERAKIQSESDAEQAERTAKETAAQKAQREAAERGIHEHVITKYPELLDPEKGLKLGQAITDTARGIGYTDAEIAHTFDPRGFDLLYKATQYDLLMREKAGVTQRKADGPPAAPAGVRIVKGNAPRPRPLTVERARMGGTRAAFNADPSFEKGLADYNAATAYAQKRR